ncbi:MAG: type II/IV secretion system protein [bacterium]
MRIETSRLREFLVNPGYISDADFSEIEKQALERNEDLQDLLIDKELIKDEELGQLIADDIGFPFANLRKEKIDEKVLSLIPELVARSKEVVAFGQTKDVLKIGLVNPNDLETRHIIEKRVGQKLAIYYITSRDLQSALTLYQGSFKEEVDKILENFRDPALTREAHDGLIVKAVDALLEYGWQNKASDIHLEPRAKKAVVRFRIDGVMHEVLELPKDLHDLILMRIKILAKMRTDEHRAAQDGKLRFKASRETIDIRVSVVPIVQGENLVMRLLSAQGRQFGLVDLGFSDYNLKIIQRALKSSYGMILVTGPTGCGKTTTLYAIMKKLNNPEIHIATIEDPVEYDIEGISQIQVNTKTNLTFAKGLRAIVRQDPDIIMVGEIRDKETASIAVNSALTGHLVLSTLHTNDAATALPRLLDMSIEPFLLASTVNVVIAQRLVRKICERCRASHKLTEEERRVIKINPSLRNIFTSKGYTSLIKVRTYRGNGCKVCANTGFVGRIGIFEVLEMSDGIKELVINHASSNEIIAAACKNGMKSILEDGVDKVLQGITTLSEVIRVTKE